MRRFEFWLRKHVPPFREERLIGASLIWLRAWIQIPFLFLRSPSAATARKVRICSLVIPKHSMIAPRLLFRMWDLAEEVERRGVEGAVVECGAWNGGSAALLAVAASSRGSARDIWVFDSFQGLPPPSEMDPEIVRSFFYAGWNKGSATMVEEVFRRCGLRREKVHIVPGWFAESFPKAQVERVAILHIDSDWYLSVKTCLQKWFDHVVPGGVVIMNDYDLYPGANRALSEFQKERSLDIQVHRLGKVGAYFHK